MVQLAKNPPAMRETWVRSLGWGDSLEEGKATHSSRPWGCKELDMTERFSLFTILFPDHGEVPLLGHIQWGPATHAPLVTRAVCSGGAPMRLHGSCSWGEADHCGVGLIQRLLTHWSFEPVPRAAGSRALWSGRGSHGWRWGVGGWVRS